MEIARKIAELGWTPVRFWYYARDFMRLPAFTRDPDGGVVYKFRCDSFEAYQRARRFLGKEPDTINWIKSNLERDDVFLDIGANVGIFSLYVGKRLSEAGRVYACEPHLPTATQLLRNVSSNDLDDRVTVLSVAVAGEDGFISFRLRRWREGASGSQLGISDNPVMKTSVATELKCAVTIDSLVERGVIRAPDLIKIDTDGVEIPIAKGMRRLLTSDRRPRSILIEVQRGEFQDHLEYFGSVGFRLVDTHVIGRWKKLQDGGASLDELAFNAIFSPDADGR